MVAMSVDKSLLKKNNSAFHQRRIQFKESTRLDLKQERLKKKYRPVNAPLDSLPNGSSTPASVPYSGGSTSGSGSSATEDTNGFKLPSKILFSKEKVQLAWPTPRPIGPGLNNLGNTCFLNSVLQCLTYTAPLANYLLSNHHTNSCKTTNFCMMCILEKHVGRCFTHNMSQAIAPKVIVGRLRNIGKQFRIGRQEDSHEFARYLIDALQKSCLVGYDSKLDDRIKETTIIHQIFGGYFQSQVKCMKCGYESNTFETYLDISLDIRGADSIQKAFRDYTKAEILSKGNQYKCDKCKVLVDARKQMTIYDAPMILCVHLKRFTFTGQKINRHVEFETKLELNSVMSTNKKHPDLRYSLYAVLVHAGGSCHSGHYYCYVKSSNGIWYSMNDSHVSVVSLHTVLKQNAYMLFYTQDKTGGPQKASVPNGVQNKKAANGMANGHREGATPQQVKRPRLDDDEIGAKVERSSVAPMEKRPKIEETNGHPTLGQSKEERLRLKKEKKKAKKQEKWKAQQAAASGVSTSTNDYELATTTESSQPKSIFGVSVVQSSAAPSKSPLADLDSFVIMAPTPSSNSAVTPSKPSSILIPANKSQSEWKVDDGTIKSPVKEKMRQFQLLDEQKKKKREYVDREREQDGSDNSDEGSPQVEQGGWTVKVTQPIVVAHNEASASKREKLLDLIARESEVSKSADVKAAILGEQKHMLGSRVSTWEDVEGDTKMTQAREEVLRTLKPKHHRPDAYDVDYDRGKVKKIKKKNVMDGVAVGAKVANKFQKEQDVRNLVKPKFKKNKKNGGKKMPNAL